MGVESINNKKKKKKKKSMMFTSINIQVNLIQLWIIKNHIIFLYIYNIKLNVSTFANFFMINQLNIDNNNNNNNKFIHFYDIN